MILLGLDAYGGSLVVPGDLTTMPMTLPVEIVENVRATLEGYTSEEVEELRAALPNALDAIREELTGLLDEAAASRGSSSRAAPSHSSPAEPAPSRTEDEDEGDTTELMQRTMTGMMRRSAPRSDNHEAKMALHRELQNHAPGTSAYLSQRLRQRLARDKDRIADWASVDAILAANMEAAVMCPVAEEEQMLDEWINKWTNKLVRRTSPDRAVSSSDPAPHLHGPIVNDTDLYEARAREEAEQDEADQALYGWHLQQRAAEAKQEDEIALQSELGISFGRPKKKVRLTIEIARPDRVHYAEYEVHEGEEIKIGVSMNNGPERAFLQGRPVAPNEAREHVRRQESKLRRETTEEGRVQFNLEDPSTKALYNRWIRGVANAQEVMDMGGGDLIQFFEAVRELDQGDVLPPTLPPGGTPEATRREAANKREQTLAKTIQYNYLGERWKELMGDPEYAGTYAEWRSGRLGEDLVVLRYGPPTMALFRYLLAQGHHRLPRPTECGSDTSEAETVDADGTAGLAPHPHEFPEGGDGPTLPDDAETLLLGGGSGPVLDELRDSDLKPEHEDSCAS